MKIGIIGIGFVGGTARQWFEGWLEPLLYDKFKGIGSVSEVNQADIIFVAVPTPFIEGKGYDDSAVLDALNNIEDNKIVVIKSTVIPGSTKRFQAAHPNKTIVFNPEFLREKTAFHDFINPDRQLIGYVDGRGKKVAQKILDILPAAPYTKILPSLEVELVKYFSNTFLAARVIFGNQLFDICAAAGADYDVVKEAAGQDPRIGLSHFDVFDDGFRGYGGHCLPKDTKALIQFAQSIGVPTDFLDSLERINNELISKPLEPVWNPRIKGFKHS